MKKTINCPLVLLIIFTIIFTKRYSAQYDTIHYLPPIYVANSIKNNNSNVKDHYLVLSTLEPISFTVTLKDGAGSLFTGYSLQTGSQVSPGVVNLSRTSPIKLKFSGTGEGVQNIVSRSSLNTVITVEGLVFEASKPFFANIRHISGAQAGSLITKGNAGLGTDFFTGYQFMKPSSSSVNDQESHFFSVMATEDNTSITFSNFKPGVTFYGRGIDTSVTPGKATDTTISLNKGESFVQAQEKYLMPSYSKTNDYNGIRIMSDKKIAVNSGSLMAVQDGNGRDIGMDQIAPTRLAGTKYGIIRGNGNNNREKVIVVTTEPGNTILTTSNGPVTINGLGGHVILNDGYWNTVSTLVSGSNGHRNMVFTSDKPVMVYHTTFGADAGNTNSMNIIPPIADCIGSDSIYVANARQFGSSSKINIISKVGSTIYVKNQVGTVLLTIPGSATSNFTGTSLNTHLSTAFVIPSSASDIFVHGDDKFSLGFFGASGNAGGAGYMSSFSLTDVEIDNNTAALLNNGGVLKVDLCEVSQATIEVSEPQIYSDFQWYKDGASISGETNSTINVSSVGNYYVKATYCSFDISTASVSVDHFGTPGNDGLTNLAILYQADMFDGFANNSTVSTWQDEGQNGNNASGVSSPVVMKGMAQNNFSTSNYNSTLSFEAANSQYFKTANSLASINGSNNFTFFIILKNNNTLDGSTVMSFSNESDAPRLVKVNNGFQFIQGNIASPTINTSINGTIGEYHIVSGVYNGSSISLYLDGKKGIEHITNSNLSFLSEMIIGGGAEGTSSYFDGDILGVSVLENSVSLAERQKMESYFALKYGITLDHLDDETIITDGNYVSSAGTVIWNYNLNTTYHNMIAGIGYDKCGKLNQRQATSIKGDIVTVGLGTIHSLNSENTESFSTDDSYFIFGNNNEENDSFKVTDFGTSLNGENIEGRIKRIWKGQETGTIGQLTLRFDLSQLGNGTGGVGTNDLSKVRLLIDNNSSFAVGATSITPNNYNQATGVIEFIHDFNNTTGFFFTLGSIDIGGATLPVELLSFNADLESDVVNLSWETLTEINNDYFVIERSKDTKEWEEIGEVKGAGNSVGSLTYISEDINPLKNISYYRLKQIDYDYNYTYSTIKKINNIKKAEEAIAYPNPTQANVLLSINDADTYEFILLNSIGQKIECKVNKNKTEATLLTEGLSKGIYFINIVNKDSSQIIKLIKE